MTSSLPVFIALSLVATAAHAQPTIDQMRNHRRVLIVAAPDAGDARLIEQRRLLAGWNGGAQERDVTVVELVDSTVRGSSDDGRILRRTMRLPRGRFAVILIGKDGHEALRSRDPVSGQALSDRIDAMPMRRAGGR